MTSSKKRAWVAMALVAVGVTTAVWWWTAGNRVSPVILTLPDGEQFRFAGITYGTKNTPPIFLARLADWLPTNLAKYVRSHAGSRLNQSQPGQIYPEPQYFVWFEKMGTNPAPANSAPYQIGAQFYAILSDEANVEGGMQQDVPWFSGTGRWEGLSFRVFPRRSRIIHLNLYPSLSGIGGRFPAAAQVSFPNPFYGHYPQWHPEPVPAVKQVGDMEVRLENCAAGVTENPKQQVLANGRQGVDFRPAREGEHAIAYFDVLARSTRDTNEAWVVQAFELSDASGNLISSPSSVSGGGDQVSPATLLGEYRFPLWGTLWPSEDAWRLKLRLKRKAGFPPEDLTTFTNLPVPAIGTTNPSPTIRMVGGVKLALTLFPQNQARTVVRVEFPDHPEGVAVDFVRLTTDAGEEFKPFGTDWDQYLRIFNLAFDPTKVKTVDLTLVVQKTRSVEFLVKPPN